MLALQGGHAMNARSLTRRISIGVLCATLLFSQSLAYAGDDKRRDDSCLPGLADAFDDHREYGHLYSILASHRSHLRLLLSEVSDQKSYEVLLARAELIASRVTDGRVLVALPDGTVVLDTARPDDPQNLLPSGNSFQHFEDKTVNENHNSRVAILSAQLFPCGIGAESKLSTTTGDTESYVAIRLGAHLDNLGTVRLSITQ
jgi:hypothetical protein